MAVEVVNLMDLIEEEKRKQQQPLKVSKVCRFTTRDNNYDYIAEIKGPEKMIFCKTNHGKMNHQEIDGFIDEYLDSFVKGANEKSFYNYVIQFDSNNDKVEIGAHYLTSNLAEETDRILRVTPQRRKKNPLEKVKTRFSGFNRK